MSAEKQPIQPALTGFRHIRILPNPSSEVVPDNVIPINAHREPTPPKEPIMKRLFTSGVDQLANRKHVKRNVLVAGAITVGALFGPHLIPDAKSDSKVTITTPVKISLDK